MANKHMEEVQAMAKEASGGIRNERESHNYDLIVGHPLNKRAYTGGKCLRCGSERCLGYFRLNKSGSHDTLDEKDIDMLKAHELYYFKGRSFINPNEKGVIYDELHVIAAQEEGDMEKVIEHQWNERCFEIPWTIVNLDDHVEALLNGTFDYTIIDEKLRAAGIRK